MQNYVIIIQIMLLHCFGYFAFILIGCFESGFSIKDTPLVPHAHIYDRQGTP